MKTTLGLIVLYSIAFLLGNHLYAEPAPAAFVTPSPQDSKRPPADSSDASSQAPAPAHPDSKNDATKPSTTPTSTTTTAAPAASKTPQKDKDAQNK